MHFKLYVFGDNPREQAEPFDSTCSKYFQFFDTITGTYHDKPTKNDCIEVNPDGQYDNLSIEELNMWGDFFLLKNGSRTYSTPVIDIDFKTMYSTQHKKVVLKLRKLMKTIGSWDGFKTTEELISEYGIEEGRKRWEEQPQVIAIRKQVDFFWDNIDNMSRSQSADYWTNYFFAPYAYIKDGQWFFAKDSENWYEILTNLNPNTTVTVCCCHV